jgi:hypothetical protein
MFLPFPFQILNLKKKDLAGGVQWQNGKML